MELGERLRVGLMAVEQELVQILQGLVQEVELPMLELRLIRYMQELLLQADGGGANQGGNGFGGGMTGGGGTPGTAGGRTEFTAELAILMGYFGIGGGSSSQGWLTGGGGGWYGGAATTEDGGGGSGYVLTASSYKPSGYLLGSEYYLTDAQSIAGDQSFPAPDGGTETGHRGNGYARITLVE